MIRYLTMLQFTDQGAQNVDKSVQRASDFGKSVSDAGGKLVLQVWTVGQYDGCVVFEVPDETIHGSDSTFPSHAGFVESVRIAQSLAGIKAKATEMSPGSCKAAPSPCSTARTGHQRPK